MLSSCRSSNRSACSRRTSGWLEISVLDLQVRPKDHLEEDSLDPGLVHEFDLLRDVPFLVRNDLVETTKAYHAKMASVWSFSTSWDILRYFASSSLKRTVFFKSSRSFNETGECNKFGLVRPNQRSPQRAFYCGDVTPKCVDAVLGGDYLVSAGPADVAKTARIIDTDAQGRMVIPNEGNNGFTCMPRSLKVVGEPPMCVDAASMHLLVYSSHIRSRVSRSAQRRGQISTSAARDSAFIF